MHGERPAPAVSSLTRAEVRQLPGAFGDPFRAIESLPGVTPIISGLPFFYIRGAPPGNVGYYLDGVRVPYLYHIAIGPSVVHPPMVDRVDLYPGGYPARFGRFAGGIVARRRRRRAHSTAKATCGSSTRAPWRKPASTRPGYRFARRPLLVHGGIMSLVAQDVTLDYRDYQARVPTT